MPMVMTMNGEQHSLAAAPLDLRTTHRERGSSGPTSPDSLVTGGSPAPPACTETDSLDKQVIVVKKENSGVCKRDNARQNLPFRKRKIPVEPETHENGDFSPRAAQENEWTTGAAGVIAPTRHFWSPFTPYVPFYYLSPVPVSEALAPVPHNTGHLLSTIALATRQDEDGDTPLHIAVVQSKMDIVDKLIGIFLLEHKSPDIYNNLRQAVCELLCMALPRSHMTPTLPTLFLNIPSTEVQRTPLHLAVITQQANMVKALVQAGADPAALDRNGQTALHLCCEYNQGECLSLLLSLHPAATCLEIRNYEGLSPLHLAVLHGHMDLATMLLHAGADINAMDNKSGQSPLMHAVESNNVNMVHFLIENGCDVNSQSYSRNTALHCACGRGQVDTVRLLLKNGADSGLKNYHNDTPVMVTTNKKIADVIRGRSSKQMRVQDQLYISTSPTHRNILEDRSPPSPNQSRGCSPSSILCMPHQTHSLSPKTGTLFSSQPLTTSAHAPGNIYTPVKRDYEA